MRRLYYILRNILNAIKRVKDDLSSLSSTVAEHTTTISSHTTQLNRIGQYLAIQNGSNVSVPNATYTQVGSYTISSADTGGGTGYWIVICQFDFTASSAALGGTGYRWGRVNTDASSGTAGSNFYLRSISGTQGGASTRFEVTFIAGFSGSRTYYAWAYQTSGAACPTLTRWQAIRIK